MFILDKFILDKLILDKPTDSFLNIKIYLDKLYLQLANLT